MTSKGLDKNIKLTIVIVDDNPSEHFFIKHALGEYKNILYNDYYSGEDLLRFLEEKSKKIHPSGTLPDIVILDVNMPKLSGFEVFELIGKRGLRHNGIQFYILTTTVTDLERASCKKYNLRCYQKPFNIHDFTELLEDMIKDYLKK